LIFFIISLISGGAGVRARLAETFLALERPVVDRDCQVGEMAVGTSDRLSRRMAYGGMGTGTSGNPLQSPISTATCLPEPINWRWM
jgi:hypothetical protein